jgi:threonylcarbamoyladenosine tRNA methylthiotransferase CDKAL1
MKVYMESYGCSANQADGEMMLGLLKNYGFDIVDSPEESDINIINTCVVKSPTENRMKYRIKKLCSLKNQLVVAGCMPKTSRKIIEKIAPKASLLGPDSIEKVVDVTVATLSGNKIVFLKDLKKPKICLPRLRKNPVIDICEISTGCLGNCSFCEVKFVKGKLFSYPIDLILKEIKSSLNGDCKEIWITSQDCGCWGFDRKLALPELLNKICEIEKKFFVRVGMMNPTHIKDMVNYIIDSYKSEKIFKFLHLPIQSGSDFILEKMHRDYSVGDFRKIVKGFRKEFSCLTLSTDIIVGFPEETEQDFKKTIDLMKEIKPNIVNISKFGSRPGTKAAKMKQLLAKVINERSKKLMKIVKEIKLKQNEKWIGWAGEVLIDEVKEKNFIGHNFAYKPVVLKGGELGEFREIVIDSASHTSLFSSN